MRVYGDLIESVHEQDSGKSKRNKAGGVVGGGGGLGRRGLVGRVVVVPGHRLRARVGGVGDDAAGLGAADGGEDRGVDVGPLVAGARGLDAHARGILRRRGRGGALEPDVLGRDECESCSSVHSMSHAYLNRSAGV